METNAVALVATYDISSDLSYRNNVFIVSKDFPRSPGKSYKERLPCEFNESDCYLFKSKDDLNILDIYVKLNQGYLPIGKYKTDKKFIRKHEDGTYSGAFILSDEDKPHLEFTNQDFAVTWLLSE